MKNDLVRIAAAADIHCHKNNRESLHDLFTRMNDSADVVLLCGDLTDTGLVEDAHILADELTKTVRIPVLGVFGNHDYDAGRQDKIMDILKTAGVSILDGDIREIRGVGFAGVKGFCGGYGKYQLQAWGETAIKNFVQESVDEELKLEAALVRLDTFPRVVLMHYAPVNATIKGEPEEIYPFLGSSRFEVSIDEFAVSAVFHGHAHHGSPEGRTAGNIPVYNVSLPVLHRTSPGRPPFRVVEIAVPPSE